MDKALLSKILGAVDNGNSRTVNSLLECKQNGYIEADICPSTGRAQDLLEAWQSQLDSEDTSRSSKSGAEGSLPPFSRIQGFRALLMIRPCYVTPWKAIVDFTTKFLWLSMEEVYLCVSTIEVFLRQVSSSIDDPSRPVSTTCNVFLIQAAQETINKLLGESPLCPNSRTSLLLDLIRSLFLFSNTSASVESKEKLLYLVFGRKLSSASIHVWIRLVQRLQSVITADNLDGARDSTLAHLKRHGTEISFDALTNMMHASMEIAALQITGEHGASLQKKTTSWYQVPIQILFAAKTRRDDYASLDGQLSTLLSGLSQAEFSEFWKIFKAETDGPEWVRANILSIICQRAQNSTSSLVSKLFFLGMEKQESAEDSIEDGCQTCLLDMLFPKKETFAQLGLTDSFEEDKRILVEMLGDVTYGGVGVFVDSDDAKVVSLSRAAKLLLSIVWIGTPAECEVDSYLRRRCLEIVKLAGTLLFGGKDCQDVRTILFFILSIAVIYVESPSCRETVGDLISKGLLWNGKDCKEKNASIAAAALIVGSRHDVNLDTQYLEPFVSMLQQPLDAETYMQLAACLSSCDSARAPLMNSATALLNRSYSGAWDDSGDVETRSADMVRAALFGLLELLRSPPWDKIALESWIALSDCIVMDSPPLKLSDRTWLYEQITYLIQDEELDMAVARHFLRATIARLAKFVLKETPESSARFVAENAFIVWDDPYVGFTRTRQTEDLVGLLRLSLSLLFQDSYEKGDASPMIQNGKIHDLLIRRIVCYTYRMTDSDCRDWHQKLKACFQESIKDAFMLQFSTLLTYFAAVFDYLTQAEASHSDGGNPSLPDHGGYEILARGLSCVVEQERKALDSEATRVFGKAAEPQWLTTDTGALMSSREVDVEPASLVALHTCLCELLVEVLCGRTLLSARGRHRPLNLCRNIVVAVGCMLELKQIRGVQAVNLDSNDPFSTLNAASIASTAPEFFSAASRVVQDIVSHNSPLEDAEKHLTSIILFCEAIDNSHDNVEAEIWLLLLQSLWVLYQVIGSEKGASRFIAYLESNVPGEATVLKTDHSVCSLKSIRSADDVDNSIRGIRVALLKALERCLQFASGSVLKTVEIHSVKGSASVETSGFNELLQADSAFIAVILGASVQDLKDGLEGHSGGITTEMFESYLASIQACAILIYQLSSPNEGEVISGILSIYATVVKSIREILKSFPLADAELFRSSLIIATAEIPSITREMLRDQLLSHPMESSLVRKLMNPESGLIAGLFNDCSFILTRWSSLRDPNSVPWEDIAGKVHTGGIQDRDKSFTNEEPYFHERRGGETLNEVAAKQSNDSIVHPIIEVSLGTKERWSWALSCMFLAFEENWLESFRSVVDDKKRPGRIIDVAAYGTMLDFLSWRQKDLHLSLERVAKLFASSTAVVESRAQPAVLDMLAMNLPSAPRLRFCHLVATIARVLRFSIDHLCSCLNASSKPAYKIHVQLSFLESLSTVGAWLKCDDARADFPVGAFRWLSILRRKRPPGEHPSKRIDNTELVPWVEKVSFLVRDLHVSLRNFDRVISGCVDIVELGPALSTFFSGGLPEMIRLTKHKVRLLELAMPSEYTAPSLPDFPSLSETNSTKKKRIRRHSSSRPKKRAATHIAKSRSRIVNAFMSLDRKNDAQDGAPSDAFVDLEDFLVEG